MNEEDLKRAFQDVVASSPPPMDPGSALGAARKARSQRRASVTGALVALLVVGVGLGSAFAMRPDGTGELVMGAGQSSSSSTSSGGGDASSKVPWPNGQENRTATNGPQADRGVQLLNAISQSAQAAGFQTPDLKHTSSKGAVTDMRRTQAQFDGERGETPERWRYTAWVPVQKDGKLGLVIAEVATPRPDDPSDPCALAKRFWNRTEALCKVREVNGIQVGDATYSEGGHHTHWITHRAPNGWTVNISQNSDYPGSGYPALDQNPFTADELARVAIDPKFVLG